MVNKKANKRLKLNGQGKVQIPFLVSKDELEALNLAKKITGLSRQMYMSRPIRKQLIADGYLEEDDSIDLLPHSTLSAEESDALDAADLHNIGMGA